MYNFCRRDYCVLLKTKCSKLHNTIVKRAMLLSYSNMGSKRWIILKSTSNSVR